MFIEALMLEQWWLDWYNFVGMWKQLYNTSHKAGGGNQGPEVNKKIVLLFLEKLENLNSKEREIICTVIELIAKPMFIIDSPYQP